MTITQCLFQSFEKDKSKTYKILRKLWLISNIPSTHSSRTNRGLDLESLPYIKICLLHSLRDLNLSHVLLISDIILYPIVHVSVYHASHHECNSIFSFSRFFHMWNCVFSFQWIFIAFEKKAHLLTKATKRTGFDSTWFSHRQGLVSASCDTPPKLNESLLHFVIFKKL